MTAETTRIYDVLVTDGQPHGKLMKVGAAFPTPKGTGYRFTLKADLSQGAQLVLMTYFRVDF